MKRALITAFVAGLIGFTLGWYCSPNKLANEKGLIGIIATQAQEISVLNEIVETYR